MDNFKEIEETESGETTSKPKHNQFIKMLTFRVVPAYYREIEKDYDMMKKYYLMAFDNGDARGINNLAIYYKNIKKDYNMMEKYRIMSKLKSANQKDECMVCYEENKKMYYTSCNRHYICCECSIKLYNKKCPMCRQ